MKKKTLQILFMQAIFIFLMAGCSSHSGTKDLEFQLVEIDNVDAIFNMTRSGLHFGSFTDEYSGPSIMVAEGDLLFIVQEDVTMFFRYRESDGAKLAFSTDTTDYSKFYLQDKLISISLSDDSVLCGWINSADPEMFEDLRSVYISLPISEIDRTSLKILVESSTVAGLVMEGSGKEVPDLNDFSSLRPEWMFLTDLYLDEQFGSVNSLFENIELLGIAGEDLHNFVGKDLLPALRSLIIEQWDPVNSGYSDLPNRNNLESLTLTESEITDISVLGELPELRSLHLIKCDTLTIIDSLIQYQQLQSLGLSFCDNISNLDALMQIPSLKWLSFPPATQQENFFDITNKHTELEVIELISCKNIHNLSPVENTPGLNCIILDIPDVDFAPLRKLEQLELVIIEEDRFEELEDEILQLQEDMPGIQILPGGGFCLGSGWILLLFPALLIFIFVLRRRKSSLPNNPE